MSLQYTVGHRSAAMNDLNAAIGTTGNILIYTGSTPGNVASAATGTLLVTLPCSNPFGANTSNGVLVASAISSNTAIGTGTAGYFRVATNVAGTTAVIQGNVGTSGSDLNLNSTAISSGQTITITSFQITAFGA